MKTAIFILSFTCICLAGYKTDSLWVTKYLNWNSGQIHYVYNRVQLDSAVSKLSSKGGTIEIVDTIRLIANDTIPSKIELLFSGKGYITGNYIFNIGQLGNRPMHQIFDTSLTVQFAEGAVDEVKPEWFGLSTSNTAINNSLSITRCFGSISKTGGGIVFPYGTFLHNGFTIPYPQVGGTISGEYGFTVMGQGRAGTILKHTGTGVGISTQCNYVNFHDFYISGNANTTSNIRLNSTDTNFRYASWRSNFHDITIDSGQIGILFPSFPLENSFKDIYIFHCSKWGMKMYGQGTTTTLTDMQIRECANGLYISGLKSDGTAGSSYTAMNYFLKNVVIESNTDTGMYVDNATGFVFDGLWFEGNKRTAILKPSVNNFVFKNLTGTYSDIVDSGYNNQFSNGANGQISNTINMANQVSGSEMFGGFQGTVINHAWDASFKNGLSMGSTYDSAVAIAISNDGCSDNYCAQIKFKKGHPIGFNYRSYPNNTKNTVVPANSWAFMSFSWKTIDSGATTENEYLIAGIYTQTLEGSTKHIFNKYHNIWNRNTLAWFNNTGVSKYINFYFSIGGNTQTDSNLYIRFDDLQLEVVQSPFAHSGLFSCNNKVNPAPTSATTGYEDTTFSGLMVGRATFNNIVKIKDTTNSTSTTTGSIVTSGGLGSTKNIFSGAKIQSGDTLRTGNASSYAQLDSVNGLLLAGNATVWDDIRIVPGSTDRPGTSDPSLVPYGATYLWEYQVNDSSTFTIQLPHGYSSGDSIFAHAHWTPGTRGNEEGTATVGWKIGYSWASIDSVFPAFAVVDLFDSCKATDGQHLMTPEVGIPGSGKRKSSMLLCNIKRTDTGADDTWAGTASGQLPFLLEIDFHIPLNSLGSPTR